MEAFYKVCLLLLSYICLCIAAVSPCDCCHSISFLMLTCAGQAIHLGDFFSDAFALCGKELAQQDQLEQVSPK